MRIELCLKLDGRSWDEVLGCKTNAIQTRLLSFHSLAEALGRVKARKAIKEASVYTEVNEEGERRCVALVDGIRCCDYSSGPLCLSHHIKIKNSKMSYAGFFKDKTLAQEFLKFRNDKHRSSLEGEQALLRTMLAQFLKRLSKAKDIPVEAIAQVAVMCKQIADLSQKMTAINEVTPDQIELLLSKVVEVMAEFVPVDRLEAANTKLAELTTVGSDSEIAYEPGALIEIDGEEKEVTVEVGNPINTKALLDSFARLQAEEELNNAEG